jgi:hypothetical protein
MNKALTPAIAFAALLSVGAAFAQTSPAVVPSSQGQASTETRAGVPNPTQRPDGSMPASRDAVKAEARANNRNPANTTTPGGEASTRMNNQPNVMPPVMSGTSRAEVRQDAIKPTRQFGQTGERPDVPTNPKNSTGTPK